MRIAYNMGGQETLKSHHIMKTQYPTFDKRDGAKDEALQFTPIRQILGFPWNRGLERSFSGCSLDHKADLARLKSRASKAGEKILAAEICNYAVTILVESNV